MIDKSIYCHNVYSDTKSIEIMDEFEKRDSEGKKLYSMLKLINVFVIKYRRQNYWISLSVKRMPKNVDFEDSSLTFTKLKKQLAEHVFTIKNKDEFLIVNKVFESIKNAQLPKRSKECIEIVFDKPVKFNAQNSSNRSGYGNRYYFGECVYEGTLYGETSDYMFSGCECTRW